MLEKKIERRLVEGVKKRGGMCLKFVSPSTPGVPDRIIITKTGHVIFAELKTETGRLSKMQQYITGQMMQRKADVRVLYGVSAVDELLAELGAGT